MGASACDTLELEGAVHGDHRYRVFGVVDDVLIVCHGLSPLNALPVKRTGRIFRGKARKISPASVLIDQRFIVGRNLSLGLSVSAGIVLLLAGAAFWVGVPLVNLAFFDERRDQPLMVIELLKTSDTDLRQARYQTPMAELLASEGARLQVAYQMNHLMDGNVADEWRYLNLISVPRAADFVQVMTSESFKLLQEQRGISASSRLGVFHAAGEQWRPALVVWLVKTRQSDALDPFAETLPLWQTMQGRVVVNQPLLLLDNDSRFDRVLIVEFPSVQPALTLLRSPQMRTLRSVVNGAVDHMALALYAE